VNDLSSNASSFAGFPTVPPSERLEQRESYRLAFESRVSAVHRAGGAVWAALLASGFYPEAGGQPADTGTLNGVPVSDVQLVGKAVWHRLSAPLAVGQPVRGEIDWPRRYRHMQRHSAQHLLSQAFARVNPAFETRSVSLSGPICTLDLAGEPSESAALEAESLANDIAYQNLPIRAFEVGEDEVSAYPLRRPPKVRGRIRLVAMGDWELSACGGTHLRATAEALPIKVLGRERVKQGLVRVQFSAGLEALGDYREKHRVLSALVQRLSTPVPEVLARVSALQDDLRAQALRVRELERALAAHEAAALLEKAAPIAGSRVVSAVVGDPQVLAAALCSFPDVVALLGCRAGGKAALLFMRGEAAQADMAALLRAALPEIAGRGGGSSERAQGGGERVAGLEAALARAVGELGRGELLEGGS
jgi:alanyl-tRNA synthetase